MPFLPAPKPGKDEAGILAQSLDFLPGHSVREFWETMVIIRSQDSLFESFKSR